MSKKLNSSKRHCMVVYAHYPLGETRVQREAEALVNHGFEVDVICLQETTIGEPKEENVNGVHAYRVPILRRKRLSFAMIMLDYLLFFFLAMFKLTRLYLKQRYHSIQVHNLPDFLVFAAWLPKMMGTPIILDLHDLMPEFYVSRSGRDLNTFGAKLIVWQEKISCGFADHVITVTELWRQALIKRGIPAEKVSVVMNVADNRIFHQGAAKLKTTPKGTFTLVYHGLQVQRYGLDLILHALAQLRERMPNLRLLLHGNGEYHKTLKALANELKVDDLVNFSTDFVDVAELPKLVSTADVGVVPYRRDIFTDGILPTKLMEYTALGMPVIVARTPVIEEYFDDSMVEFFTPDDINELTTSILKLYQDRSRWQVLAQNTCKFNEKYSWTKLSTDYVSSVERLINQKSDRV